MDLCRNSSRVVERTGQEELMGVEDWSFSSGTRHHSLGPSPTDGTH